MIITRTHINGLETIADHSWIGAGPELTCIAELNDTPYEGPDAVTAVTVRDSNFTVLASMTRQEYNELD